MNDLKKKKKTIRFKNNDGRYVKASVEQGFSIDVTIEDMNDYIWPTERIAYGIRGFQSTINKKTK